MTTKRFLCEMAFNEIGLASYVYDIDPQEMTAMLFRLEGMMATWEMAGIRVGYNRTADPLSADPDQESGIPDITNETVWTNLAIKAAPSYGKSLSSDTKNTAKQGYDLLLGIAASNPPQVQLRGNLPIGAGAKRPNSNGGPFVAPPQDLLTTGPDGLLELDGPSIAVP